MVSTISDRLGEIAALCDRYHVLRLELFGSAAGESFDPQRSDLDFIVAFGPIPEGSHADCYFGLLFGLEDMFGRHVDLVVAETMWNEYFIEAIKDQRTVLYEHQGDEVPA